MNHRYTPLAQHTRYIHEPGVVGISQPQAGKGDPIQTAWGLLAFEVLHACIKSLPLKHSHSASKASLLQGYSRSQWGVGIYMEGDTWQAINIWEQVRRV